MKEGQYIYVEDKFGVCIGIISELYSEDQLEITLLTESIKDKVRIPAKISTNVGYNIDLRRVKKFKIYETQEELIENHFEYFL